MRGFKDIGQGRCVEDIEQPLIQLLGIGPLEFLCDIGRYRSKALVDEHAPQRHTPTSSRPRQAPNGPLSKMFCQFSSPANDTQTR